MMQCWIIRTALRLLAVTVILVARDQPAFASHLVTGNGFGFAVVAPENGAATKFYPHPYSFVSSDSAKPLGEGIETPNFIKRLDWGETGGTVVVDYVGDSHVIRMRRANGTAHFYMPFGLERPALIISLEASRKETAWRLEWNWRVRSEKIVSAAGAELIRFDGLSEPLLLIPFGSAQGNASGQPLAANRAWALIALDNEAETEIALGDFARWRAGLSAKALVSREVTELENWRAKPRARFSNAKEWHLWRQSETMLRMAQSREPNRPDRHGNGLIVAALPDVYSTPWVRDMAWASVALIRMGHRDEARAALLAYFNAQPTGKMSSRVNGSDYQISVVRYWGDGAEEPFFTQEGATNIEYDDWGEALWVLGEYLREYGDPSILKALTYRGPLYEAARDFIVKPLIANMQRYGDGLIVDADTSIWEEHEKDKKHFAFSTAMAMVGLGEFARVAQLSGDEATQKEVLKTETLLAKGFRAAFIRDRQLHGTLEPETKNDIDGALLPIINFGIVREPKLIADVVRRMKLLKVRSGGYRRVRSNYTDPKIFEYWYERQEFLFVDFSLAELERRLGRKAQADAMLQRIVGKAAADHNIIPEMYVALPCALFPGKIGDPTGALPMVGYGAGAYILHMVASTRLDDRSR